MKISTCITVILFSTLTTAFGQHTIKGRVVDDKGAAVVGGVVTQLQLPDSTVVAFTLADTSGHFILSTKRIDRTVVEISYLGFHKKYIDSKTDLGTITLTPQSYDIDKVVVTGERPEFKRQADRFVYSPASSKLAKDLFTYDMLTFAPLLKVEGNSISLLGKGRMTVYIDGRLPNMDQESLFAMLRSTPADMIDRVEIITAPGSSFKAATGGGGVVNIVMKKDQTQGFQASFDLSDNVVNYMHTPRASASLRYVHKKLSLSSGLSFYELNRESGVDSEYDYFDSGLNIRQNNTTTYQYQYYSASLTGNYKFNDRNMLGASFRFGTRNSTTETSNLSQYLTKGNIDSTLRSTDIARLTPNNNQSLGANIYYNTKLGAAKQGNLDISIDYSQYKNKTQDQMAYEKMTDADYLLTRSFLQIPAQDGKGYDAKVDYSNSFDKGGTLQVGAEIYGSHVTSDFRVSDIQGGIYVNDPKKSNLFRYDETISALYAEYEYEFNDQWSAKVGVRGEHTYMKGDQVTDQNTFSNNYFNIFPALNVNWRSKKNAHSLSFDFSSRIHRPAFYDLNPFKLWTSQNTYEQGNIDLKPVKSYNLGLTYILLKDYIFSAYYYYSDNVISDFVLPGPDNTTVTTVRNYTFGQTLALSFQVRKSLFDDIWYLSGSFGATYRMGKGEVEDTKIDFSGWSYYFDIRSVARVWESAKLDFTVYYSYRSASNHASKSLSSNNILNISLRKQFRFGGIISMGVYNILGVQTITSRTFDNYRYEMNPYSSSRSYHISYSQRLGRKSVRGARNNYDGKLDGRGSK